MVGGLADNMIATDISIVSPIERVWSVLTSFSTYGSWNPYMIRIEGEAKSGVKIAVHLASDQGRAPLVQSIDVVAVAPYYMRWQGGLPDRSEFAGDHWFELIARDRAEILFRHYEYFSGSRLPEFLAVHAQAAAENFRRFNRALKACCEASFDPQTGA